MPIPAPPESPLVVRLPSATPAPALVEARRRLLFDEAAGRPLDIPARLLAEYYADRRGSPLRRIVEAANRWALELETAVLLAPARPAEVARAVMEAVAHPYYNALSHGARGGRPRLAILEPVDDDDLIQGVLDLVRRTDESVDRHDRWGVWIEGLSSGNPPSDAPPNGNPPSDAPSSDLRQTAAPLLAALHETTASDAKAVARAIATASPADAERLAAEDRLLTVERRLDYPTLWDGAGFAAAALCGADVVGLAKGMTWFVERMKRSAPAECPVTQFVGWLTAGPARLVVRHHAVAGLAGWFAGALNRAARRRGETADRVVVVRGWEQGAAADPASLAPARSWELAVNQGRRDRLGASTTAATESSADHGSADRTKSAADLAAPGREVSPNTPAAAAGEIRLKRLNDTTIGELCAWLSAAKLLWEAVS